MKTATKFVVTYPAGIFSVGIEISILSKHFNNLLNSLHFSDVDN